MYLFIDPLSNPTFHPVLTYMYRTIHRDLNGRFFAGRQIAASFYPEDRYHQRDLAPDSTEQSAWSKLV